jgi:hypothetical protein
MVDSMFASSTRSPGDAHLRLYTADTAVELPGGPDCDVTTLSTALSPGADEQDVLRSVRGELDRLVLTRFGCRLTEAEEARYDALCRQERDLLGRPPTSFD